ncbi:Leu/Phe/Val dehydrogenase [Pontibacter sp. JAM-7]|uniref:Leu/Phe/Val dehydrogenase n=1 Tax=Pontibacter sp. JAM-7 TaxID=3366581 RepID=UPI003AF6895E
MFAEMEQHDTRYLHLMHDRETGLKAIIAVHSLTRGPAIGGCRFIHYTDDTSAIHDAVRLARGMSYKAALADLPHGGAKAVIIRPTHPFNRQLLMQAFGRFINTLRGDYITAMDSGTRVSDMDLIRSQTPWVSCTHEHGDPAPYTALGVVEAIRQTVAYRLGPQTLRGLHIALQGAGHVGMRVAKLLHQEGVILSVADIDPASADRCAREFNAHIVSPESIYDIPADLFCPCGLGAVLNRDTINRLQTPMVVGSANNQLAEEQDAIRLAQRGILYAPDFMVNAGGLIFVALQYAGQSEHAIQQKIIQIGTLLYSLFQRSDASHLTPHLLAQEHARQLLKAADPLHSAA